MMMKRGLYLFLWLCLSVLLGTCSDNIGKQSDIAKDVQLSVKELPVIDSRGETVYFNILSTVPWSIESEQDWCSVSPSMGGIGKTAVSVTCSENRGFDERNTGIVVRYGENQLERLLLVQKQKDALLLSSNKVEVDSEATEVVVRLQSNVPFTYEVDATCADWITGEKSRGLQDGSFILKIGSNVKKEKREGIVVVKGGDIQETVHVYQDGLEPSIVLSKNDIEIGTDGSEITIEVKSNFEYEISLFPQVDWIKLLDSRAISSYTHHFIVSANDSYDSRKTEIRFHNKDLDVEEIVSITQMQRDAIVIAQSEYTISADMDILSFEINTNVDFKTDISVDWIRRTRSSRGLEVLPLDFSIDRNPSVSAREGIITFSYGEIRQDIKVVQEGWSEYSRFSITFEGQQFVIPCVVGENLFGVIDWGDGITSVYEPGMVHTYDYESNYLISSETSVAKEIRIEGIKGVQMIDLTEF